MNVESLLVAVAGLPVLSGIAGGVHKDRPQWLATKLFRFLSPGLLRFCFARL
jgi:hypothetical protein